MQAPPAPRRRRLGLDALRGVAVFLMIEQHVGIWMWRGVRPGERLTDYPLLVGFNALGGMAAPLFVTLAGIGSALMAAKAIPDLDRILIRRGLVLMGFGYLLNMLSPSWFSWGTWFVLHMMGFAMAFAPVWRRLPNTALLALGLAVFAGTVALQIWLHTPYDLSNERMRSLALPGQELAVPPMLGPLGDRLRLYIPWRLALAEGQFPIFPWLAFYLAGFVSGRWIRSGRTPRVAVLGLVVAALGGLGALLYQLGAIPLPADAARRAFGLKLGFFPPTISLVALLLGGALLLIAWVAWWDEKKPFSETSFWVTLGRASLTLLMIHVPVFRDLSRLPGIELWRGLSATGALAVIFGFFALAAVLTRLWQRVDYRYGAEWALRKLAG